MFPKLKVHPGKSLRRGVRSRKRHIDVRRGISRIHSVDDGFVLPLPILPGYEARYFLSQRAGNVSAERVVLIARLLRHQRNRGVERRVEVAEAGVPAELRRARLSNDVNPPI